MKNLYYILFIVFIFNTTIYATEPDLHKELEKQITLELTGISLEEALQQISAKTRLEIIPLKSLTADNRLSTTKIYLSVKDMKVRQLLEWLSGTVNTHYRIFKDGRVYLSDCYEWIASNQFGMLFLDISNLTQQNSELDNFDQILSEITKIISLFDDNYYARIEQQGEITKLVAHTPKDLKPLFHNLVIECTKQGKNIFSKEIFTHPELDKFIKKIHTVRDINYPYMSFIEIIRKLEKDFDINIGFSSLYFPDKNNLPKLSLKLGRVTLKEVIESIINKTDFTGVEISLPNGIWLSKQGAKWTEMTPRSFLWIDNIEMISYNIRKLNQKIPGEKIAEELLLRIAPQAWFDPLASIIYHNKSGNLLILADKKTQERILLALQELSRRLGINE